MPRPNVRSGAISTALVSEILPNTKQLVRTITDPVQTRFIRAMGASAHDLPDKTVTELSFKDDSKRMDSLSFLYTETEEDEPGPISAVLPNGQVVKFGYSVQPKHTKSKRSQQHSSGGCNSLAYAFEIPSIIASVNSADALGDFCATKNFMRESYAKSLGIPIDRSNLTTVSIGSGKRLSTTGCIATPFRFKNEPEVYSLLFHLLPDCIHDVILGKSFLKATNTFRSAANKARRVFSRVINGFTCRDFLYLGDSAPRFTGLVNGRVEEALADSGAKVLIMDEDYARLRGLPILTDGKHQTRLRFADGSTAMTSGMSYGVKWEFGPRAQGEEHRLDFHILKNAPASVILNDEFLFGTNAFAEFGCYLVDEDDEDEDAYFFVIDVDMSYYNEASAEVLAEYQELIRHAEELDRIDNLPSAEQPAARALEEARQTAWNAQQTSSSPSVAITSTSQPQPKRSRWRFKLFRKRT